MLAHRYVLGQRVNVLDYRQAVDQVLSWARNGEQRYVCVSNVHMIMEGHDDDAFRCVVNDADLVTPDGMPLVWALKLSGARNATQVRGPDLMPRLLEAAACAHVPVGFLGSREGTLQALVRHLQTKVPSLQIAFAESPPFRTLSAAEDDELVERINSSGTRLLFIGLGCPKQERWMAEHRDRVHAVLVGTGAAFDLLAGTKRQAPRWMSESGLEWIHRLVSEPRRLWWRYLKHNPRFVLLTVAALLRGVGAATSGRFSPSRTTSD
jgi:N-acetylglucosaminyldiphosphoundecaprenol N-acetyl-beta-D-mannosaminyltransferase